MRLYYSALFGGELALVVAYLGMRSVIWSIVWCDLGGKGSKKRFRTLYSPFQYARMRCLIVHTKLHRSNFRFWVFVKDLFWICEASFTLAAWIVPLVVSTSYLNLISTIYNTQASVLFMVMALQFTGHGNRSNTKYDQIRKNKRTKKR